MKTVSIGDVVPVRFVGASKRLNCTAVVERISPGEVHVKYLDGLFQGLRGLLRVTVSAVRTAEEERGR